jgi:hypothetical protein
MLGTGYLLERNGLVRRTYGGNPDLSGILETGDLNRPSNDDDAYLIQDVF